MVSSSSVTHKSVVKSNVLESNTGTHSSPDPHPSVETTHHTTFHSAEKTATSETHRALTTGSQTPAPKSAAPAPPSHSLAVNSTAKSTSLTSVSAKSPGPAPTSTTVVFMSNTNPAPTIYVTQSPSAGDSQLAALPTASFNNDLVGGNSFWSHKGAPAGVFTATGCIVFGVVAFFYVRHRRKLAAERRRKFAQAMYTNGMAQRRSFYDDPAPEITWPSFGAVPRSPPPPPRRRPVPEYSPESFYPQSPIADTAGLSITIPKTASVASPRMIRPSPATTMSNPFADPHVPSFASDVPLLQRTLRTDSTGHGSDETSLHSRAPSSASSTPSMYPPSLPTIEEQDGSHFAPPPMRPSIYHIPLMRETRAQNSQ